ncbi:MAG: hypothetical protein A2W31_10775, partial [Planctomycetes bacterium RBG_16_64_10]
MSINKPLTIDATALPGGLTIDASGNDPTPELDIGDGSRVFFIDDEESETDSPVAVGGLELTGGDVRGHGGAIFSQESLTAVSSTIVGNSAEYDGGGIWLSGDVTVTSSTISANKADRGGGIRADSDVTVTSSTVLENRARSDAGGILALGDVTVTSSTIQGNSAQSVGGGIRAGGDVMVTSSMISGNASDDYGGGIAADGDVTVASSTIVGNSARGSAAGILARGNVTVTSSTIVGNSARGSAGGIWASGSVTVTSSTVAGNSAVRGKGGGIYSAGTLTARNSIAALNEAISDEDLWTRRGLVTGESGFNLVGVDPHFVRNPSSGPDGRWGTEDDDYGDLRLTDESPAIDVGSNALVPPDLAMDLDGNARIYGPRVDIGAYEYQGAPAAGRETPSTLVTTAADVFDLYDGDVALREAVWYAAVGERVTFAATLDQGEIVLNQTSVLVDRSVTIDASTLESLTINAGGKSRVFTIWGNEVELTGLTITGGVADSGGGIWTSGSVTVTSSVVSGNSAEQDNGGGIWAAGNVTITSSTIAGNSATAEETNGGGIWSEGDVTVVSSTITGNVAARVGGGIGAKGNVTVTFSTVAGNSISNYGGGGGGIAASGNVTVASTTLSGNKAGGGGGINASGNVTVTSSTIVGNSSDHEGGGIRAGGNVTVTSSTITGNSAKESGGGGLFTWNGDVTVTSSTIAGNSAHDDGGGGIRASGSVTITSSIILGNSATGYYGSGGGIYSRNGDVTLTSSTIAANSARESGGGIYSRGALTAHNSIVALNKATSDEDLGILRGSVTGEAGFNLIGVDPHFVRNPSSGADGTWGTADDDYGDLRLTDHSPAIDTGSNDLVPPDLVTDLDGAARIYGPRVDIGAYEYQGPPAAGRETPSTLVTTAADVFNLYDGEISLREAVWCAAAGERITFSTSLDRGEIALTQVSLLVDRSLTIDASTLGSLTINARGKSRVFTIWGDEVELTGLTISGGVANSGGGIWTSGSVTVISSTISGNSTEGDSGGAIYAHGNVTVTSSTISGNSAKQDSGGGIYARGDVTITSSTISGNSAHHHGGGIYARGNVTVAFSTISGNSAEQDSGGGIYARGNVVVTSSTVTGNVGDGGGGGIRAFGEVTVTSSSIAGNSTRWRGSGGGIWANE